MILPIAEAISQLKWYWYWHRERSIIDFQLLDSASRGPIGSLALLCRPRRWSLATVGTLLTNVALFMKPALQLMLAYSSPLVESGAPSSIPRSIHYKDLLANNGLAFSGVVSFFGNSYRKRAPHGPWLNPSNGGEYGLTFVQITPLTRQQTLMFSVRIPCARSGEDYTIQQAVWNPPAQLAIARGLLTHPSPSAAPAPT